MTHQEIANDFKQFTYECISNEKNIKEILPSFNNDILYRRIIINRLYYALFHKYLHEDHALQSSNAPGQHTTILKKLSSKDAKLYQIYSKLYHLRIWADYNTDNNSQASELNLTAINYQVHKVLNRSTFNIS